MSIQKQKGFSLIELMIVLLISAFMLASFMELYLHAMQGFKGEQSVLQLQENQRAAAQVLREDLGKAGYMGCAHLQDAPSVIGYSFSMDNSVRGEVPDSLRKIIKPGTDVIEVKKMTPDFGSLFDTIHQARPWAVEGGALIKAGDWVMISDCHHAQVVRVDKIYQEGNRQMITSQFPIHSEFAAGSFVGLFEDNTYYIAATGRKDLWGHVVHGLYVLNIHGLHQELLEGVDDLKIRYLLFSKSKLEFLPSNAVSNWGLVKGVEVTFGFRSANAVGMDFLKLIIAFHQRLGA